MRGTAMVLSVLALILFAVGCVEESPDRLMEGPAPDFALVDYNPASSTYLSERQLSQHPGVLLLFFGSYT